MAVASTTVLSFDIGIKNLAWCVTTLSGEIFTIDGWGNYNLLEERERETVEDKGILCGKCSAKAKYTSSLGVTCARHVPTERPIWKDLSGIPYSKLPAMADIKSKLQEKLVKPLPKGKEAMVSRLQEFMSLPIQKKKVPHAAAIDVSQMHDSLRRFVQSQLQGFLKQLTEVRIENQPVLKNPVMKTIQILLFATLRDAIYDLRPKVPVFKLVHAGVKVKGAAKGDQGYKERKQGSENRTLEVLRNGKVVRKEYWKDFLEKHKKRSDLADAFCMCLDAYPESAYSKT
jgi:hypothetical protein